MIFRKNNNHIEKGFVKKKDEELEMSRVIVMAVMLIVEETEEAEKSEEFEEKK